MDDDNDNFKERHPDFRTQPFEPESASKQRPQRKAKKPKVNLSLKKRHFHLAAFLIVLTLLAVSVIAVFFHQQSNQTKTELLSTNIAEIPSFDDYVDSNIGITFRYPHLWQVYDTSDKIVIANCADTDRAVCQTTTNGVRITIKRVDTPSDFQYRRATDKGNTLYVNRSSYFVADPVSTYQIDETGLTDANRDPIMNRIFDSIVINYIID